MSTITKTRRMPVAYRVRPGGITEISYSATPQPIVGDEPAPQVRLPGTRWLDVRRAREERLAAAAETAAVAEGKSWAGRIDTAASRLVERRVAWLLSPRDGQDLVEPIKP
jgi:hypothetical protein